MASSDKFDWSTIIATVVLGIYSWLISSVVAKIFPKIVLSPNTSESKLYSNFVKGNGRGSLPLSLSQKFEEMCLINPLLYAGSKEVQEVLIEYKKVLDGKTIDKDGIHVPSMKVLNEDNPDYLRYLVNQKKAQKKAGLDVSWLTNEINRFKNKKEGDTIRYNFAEELINRSVPCDVAIAVSTYTRIESHSPEDWNKLISAIHYSSRVDFGTGFIISYLSNTENPEYYVGSMIENYGILLDEGVSPIIAKEYATLRITYSQAMRALSLYQRGHTEEEALIRILKDDALSNNKKDLVALYRSKL